MFSNIRTRPRFAVRGCEVRSSTTNKRPFSSNAIAMGELIIGSEATTSIRNPPSIRKSLIACETPPGPEDDVVSAADASRERPTRHTNAKIESKRFPMECGASAAPLWIAPNPSRARIPTSSTVFFCLGGFPTLKGKGLLVSRRAPHWDNFGCCRVVVSCPVPRQRQGCSPLEVPMPLTSLKFSRLKRDKTTAQSHAEWLTYTRTSHPSASSRPTFCTYSW